MQDQYTGDVGDFGKFGLLRHLQRALKLPTGVVWYKHPDEHHLGDGKFVRYLEDQNSYRSCDPKLWEKLKLLVDNDQRSIEHLERSKLLSGSVTYFRDNTYCYDASPGNTKAAKAFRLEYRESWLKNAVSGMADARMVFLDPDNGLEVKSCSKLNQKKSGKFTYYSEARAFYDCSDVLVVYHHLNRHKNHGSHAKQMKDRVAELKDKLNCDGAVYALRYPPFSGRAFLIACRSAFVNKLDSAVTDFLASKWGDHWDSDYVRNAATVEKA